MRIALISICLLLFSSLGHTHARLKANSSVKIRSTSDGIKTGPCGGLPRSPTPTILAAGQTVTVDWEETIYHPGRFEIYFSTANDQNFTLLKTIPQNQNNQNLPHQFSTTVTLPNVACQACTLQLIQVMLENPNVPTYYYSCADMQLNAAANTPNPTPTPAQNCPAP